MDNNTIRVGFVGAGANTKLQHLPRFKTIEGVEIISVCNRSPKSSQLVADEFDIPKIYDNWTDLVEAPDTNAICIGTWPYMHCPVTLAALQNDKHVLTEA
ncbi:MAG: Gfo/Idh/MocA family oxidoreductase, partial [Anaerolineales bacterium]|nr:Gfo/Idh/MocA family oxidoreductase [Anaerolineales bacterium]